jgi:hypothetical protein
MDDAELPPEQHGIYHVHYPSGARFSLTGRIGKVPGPDGPVPAVDLGDRVFVLDPRAIILAPDGRRVYGPRDLPPDAHDPAFATWLAERPEWDAEGWS